MVARRPGSVSGTANGPSPSIVPAPEVQATDDDERFSLTSSDSEASDTDAERALPPEAPPGDREVRISRLPDLLRSNIPDDTRLGDGGLRDIPVKLNTVPQQSPRRDPAWRAETSADLAAGFPHPDLPLPALEMVTSFSVGPTVDALPALEMAVGNAQHGAKLIDAPSPQQPMVTHDASGSEPESHHRIFVAQGCIVSEIEPVHPPENQIQFAMAYYDINYSKLRISHLTCAAYLRAHQMYEGGFQRLHDRLSRVRPWPSAEVVAPYCNGDHVFLLLYDHVFLLLYRELGVVRHIVVNLRLPKQWLWNMIDELIHQPQSFCQYCSKLKNRTEVEREGTGAPVGKNANVGAVYQQQPQAPPPAMVYVKELEKLQFAEVPAKRSSNCLSGAVGCESLRLLWLSYNNLTGALPAQLSGFDALETLELNNQGSRDKLSGPTYVLVTVKSLKVLWLQSNAFTGQIPDFSGLQLVEFNVRDNLLTGPVPASLTEIMTLNKVALSNNYLQGSKLNFSSTVSIKDVDAGNRYCLTDPVSCDPLVMILLDVASGFGYPLKLARSWMGNKPCGDGANWLCVSCVNGDVVGLQYFAGFYKPDKT